ncbi:hypothetical protein HDE_07760 [Halotydeus destructor]|nr:hypothetical protein HDE_07760 [Halotydeus destructor]
MADEMSTAPKLTPRLSRSRCFKLFKWTLVAAILVMAMGTIGGIPWYLDLTRQLLDDMNNGNTSMGQMYAAEGTGEPLEVTDELVYAVIGISVLITILYLTFGIVGAIRESFCLTLTFGISLLLCFGASIPFYGHLLFLVNMVVDLLLGLLFVFFALTIKRADRLAPESPDELDMQNGDEEKKRKHDEDRV